jgi:hypothetical protein
MKNMLAATAALSVLAFAGAASAATVNRVVLDAGTTLASRNPQAAVDAAGNVHVVSQAQSNDFISGDDIYYYRLSSAGTVLTPQFAVTTGGVGAGRSKVIALSTGKAVVAWKDGSTIMAALVDPASGGSIEAGPIAVSATCTSAGHFSMAAGADNKPQFIIGCDGPSTMAYHARLAADLTGVEVVDHAVLTQRWRGKESSVAVDADGNLHVVVIASSSGAGDDAVAYAMLDADGAVLIDETPLHQTNGVSEPGHFPKVFARADGNVLLFWGDKRFTFDAGDPRNENGQGGTMFQTVIDPSAHTGGAGNAGDIDELRVGSELQIGNAWYTHAFMGSDGQVRVVAGAGTKGAGDIVYYKVSGSSVATALVTANNESYTYYKKWMGGAGNMVVWAEGIFVPTLSGVSTRLVAARTSEFDSATAPVVVVNDDGGALAPFLLVLLGVAGLARYRVRRRA